MRAVQFFFLLLFVYVNACTGCLANLVSTFVILICCSCSTIRTPTSHTHTHTQKQANMATVGNWITSGVRVVLMIFAVCLAYANNHSGHRTLPILGALFFAEVYLIQFFIRYYVIQEEGYGLKNGTGFLRERRSEQDSIED